MQSLRLLQEKLGKPYHDLEFLMTCLKEVLEENRQDELSTLVPWVNERKEGKKPEFTDNHFHLYSIAFQLLNLVEINGAVKSRREKEEEDLASVNGSWAQNFQMLKDAGISAEQIAGELGNIFVEPVLTAHPTEAKRPVVLKYYRELYLLLVKRENTRYNSFEQEDIRNEIKILLHKLWYIGEIFIKKPEVETELDSITHYFVNVFPVVVPIIYRRMQQAWDYVGFDPEWLSEPENLPRLSFGNWVGGDRDGHPLVTAEVTQNTLAKLRLNAFIVLYREIEELADSLSLYLNLDEVSEPLQDRITRLVEELGTRGALIQQKYEYETFKMFAHLIIRKLPVNIGKGQSLELRDKGTSYKQPKELIQDIQILRDALVEFGASALAESIASKTLLLVRTFGFHLAHLDVRQNSRFHELALDQLLTASGIGCENFIEWTEEAKMKFLHRELMGHRPFVRTIDELPNESKSVLACYKVLRNHIRQYSTDGLGTLIVSMTRNASDLLTVYILAREAGLTHQTDNGIVCDLPVVPLFETIDDLERSAAILDTYLSEEIVKRSLEYQKTRDGKKFLIQDVMIGYSDSNKDGGILASMWHLHAAQIALTKVGEKHGVKIRFFHGKGGTISRGAGPVHWFLKTLPHGSIQGLFRVTEQGESIEKKYANKINAVYNLELMLAGTMGNTILHKFTKDTAHLSEDMLKMFAQESQEKYNELLNQPGFISFYEQATPIDAIETSRIGSRPSRRSGKRSLADLRAIPWVFSWGQSRYHLTSWYGVGTTLKKLSEGNPDMFEQLRKLTLTDPYIRYVFTNIDTSLAATDEDIMKQYASLVSSSKDRNTVLDMILQELSITREMVKGLLRRPMEERRTNHYYSTQFRAEALEVLHSEQIRLLDEWRQPHEEEKNERDGIEFALLRSINAIAAAMGTTG